MDNVAISLCICTMNRPEELRRCLESVLACAAPPEQILISDDSPDGTATKAVAESFPGVMYQPGPKRGLAANRNACLPVATGTHLQFADDDVVLPPDFYTRARQGLARIDAKTILTGAENRHENGIVVRVVPQNPNFFGFQSIPAQDKLITVVINSAFYPATLFEQARFDEFLRHRREELDITLHAGALGYKIVYDDDLRMEHYLIVDRSTWYVIQDAARLYVIMKWYWRYQRSPLKAAAFLVLGPLHVLAGAAKRRNPGAFRDAVTAIRQAGRFFLARPDEGSRAERP